jgi:hypothetical protein
MIMVLFLATTQAGRDNNNNNNNSSHQARLKVLIVSKWLATFLSMKWYKVIVAYMWCSSLSAFEANPSGVIALQ